MIRLNNDYSEGCHPSILLRLNEMNLEQNPGYGTDTHCAEAADAVRKAFACPDADVHFLVGGTQANMTVIAAALRPYEAVLCADTGHINVHETGAVEGTGHKCIALQSRDGRISASQISVAAAMLEKGACAVVTERPLGLPAEICVNESRRLYPELLSAFYGRPTQKLCLGAVTGTNGKTTTVNLCAQITRALGHQTGVIGTVGCDTGKGLQYSHDGPPTTPEPRKLYQLFREMADIGTEYCFLEASSMALAQHRFAAESFAVGAFTNLTQDHLDYHGTMEEYYLAKRMLADMSRTMVINIDDEYGRRTADYCRMSGIQAVTTSVNTSGADYFAEFIRLHPHGAEFLLTCPEKQKSWVAKIPLTGLYNVSNAVQAAVMCRMMGFPMEDVLAALEKSPGVSGRLETIYQGKFTVIRDYAHTGDGLEKLLSTLRPLTKRLTAVFGAAGERDSSKRPEMGRIAAKYADRLIITTDNPRHEPQQQTIDDVRRGVPADKECEEFVDRKAAIYRALETAQPGELIALCGKGHEDYQAIGDENVPFNEREIVLDWLKSRGII